MSHRRVGSYSKVHLAALLDRGELVGVAPGGGRECLLDTECSVLWHNRWRGSRHLYRDTHTHSRTGFAKVAGLTGVPLIPVYTANIRFAYRAVCLGSLLEVTRLPLVGIYRKYNI